jgi:hypothetical protein
MVKTLNYKPLNAKSSTPAIGGDADQCFLRRKMLGGTKARMFSEMIRSASVDIPENRWPSLYALTSEPIFSPVTTLRIFPRWFRLKMMMGRLLSLHREMAVESITLRPFFNMSI